MSSFPSRPGSAAGSGSRNRNIIIRPGRFGTRIRFVPVRSLFVPVRRMFRRMMTASFRFPAVRGRFAASCVRFGIRIPGVREIG